MAMVNTPAQQRKNGSIIAGIGALVGIAAFFLLPYFNIAVTIANNNSGNNSPPTTIAVPAGTGLISVFTGLIWVEELLAIAVLVVVALVMWRSAPFGATTTPVETQVRRAALATLILGIAGIVYQFLFIPLGINQINSEIQAFSVGSQSLGTQLAQANASLSVSLGFAIGFWIYLVGMAAVIIGGAMMLGVGSASVSSPQMVGMAPPPGWVPPTQYQQPSQPGWQPLEQTQRAWQPPVQPPPQGWQQPSQPQQPWQQPSQEVPRQQTPPAQDWQGWQPPPSS